jgi:hypothetical protein
MIVGARWRMALLLATIIAGCATPPPVPAPAPPAEPAREPPPPPIVCPTCDDQNREIARLRHDLAGKDTEIRELRAQYRDQVKALQESARQAARAALKLHRLATQTDAASYLAEVEVALQTLRSSSDAGSRSSLVAVAEGMLQSAAAAFERGDYGAAMDRAAQAQQLITMLADHRLRPTSKAQVSAEVPFQVPIPLRVKVDSNLRRQPRGNARVQGILKASTPLLAYAYKGNWLRVKADDGRSGWLYQALFAGQ